QGRSTYPELLQGMRAHMGHRHHAAYTFSIRNFVIHPTAHGKNRDRALTDDGPQQLRCQELRAKKDLMQFIVSSEGLF
ncbi:MAG: hypothetical protein HC842_02305, partial [Cytophagales bacterium]|nr:hypothetical protein [Cytophagales bacterium]